MNNPFVYAFGEDARDRFLSKGFTLLRSDDTNKIYVFTSESLYMLKFKAEECNDYILSNTLTFSM